MLYTEDFSLCHYVGFWKIRSHIRTYINVPYEQYHDITQCTYDIMLYIGACTYIATHILYSYIVTHYALLSIVKNYHMQRIITSVTNIDSYTLHTHITYP